MDRHSDHKARLAPFRAALYHGDAAAARGALDALLTPDAPVRMSHPFGTATGPAGFWDTALAPLIGAWPDLERRDMIVWSRSTRPRSRTGSAPAAITSAPSRGPGSTSRPPATSPISAITSSFGSKTAA
ncbi:MAG: hypothetical protein ACE368_14695 [Paracoccaceae bacterium]